MTVRKSFPRRVTVWRDVFIPLSDGTRLAAQIWLPEDAADDPVPAILEYLPYRKRDGTTERDALTHPYYAGFGYAGVRVDMRGSGDSDGVLLDEYSKQEQDDALEVIAWLAAQPWCTGAVGMIGISWGGFNGLQIAARRPPSLKAVVSLCSTDDRHADDIHFMGGCLLVDKWGWGSTMLAITSTPPDPALVGKRWRELWMRRLDESGLWVADWHRRQRRDDFYRHGSVCEDYGAIECPVYLVGGWADGYSNAIFRMLEGLKVPRKGLVGPWAHKYPHFAKPGPQIGFLQETLRWWDKWLKGVETGIMDEPMLRAWMEDPVPPRTHYEERPGRWVAEASWPSPRIEPLQLPLGDRRLGGDGERPALTIASPQTVGLAAGKWCAYGLECDLPDDQRIEAGGSLVFDGEALAAPHEILGAPVVELEVAADRPVAFVAAVLSEVLPDGAATRVTYGLLNLTHRKSHEQPEPLRPGRRYKVAVKLNDCAHRFGKGNRIRLALSTAYWPIVWPAPEPVTLTVHTGGSALVLPVRPRNPADARLPAFPPPESAEPLRETVLRQGRSEWTIAKDIATGEVRYQRLADEGLSRIDDIDWTWGARTDKTLSIRPDDPLSARAAVRTEKEFARGRWSVRIVSEVSMGVTRDAFRITASLTAFEGRNQVFARSWDEEIPRDLV
jgi:putative CocE/NonD family hydrolase